jgi:hypothetical protein
MKKIKLILMYFVVALIFFQCQEPDLVAPQQIVPEELVAGTTYQTGSTYYVSTSGNNTPTHGTASSPWRSLRYAVARVPANAGHTIKLAAGTYIEDGIIEVPPGVSIEGAGKDQTIIKAVSSFYYYPASPAYSYEKFLISLNSGGYIAGRQVLKNFTIDGDGKKLHGGIYVKYRTNVNIENVKVQFTNFTGIWLWDLKDSGMKNVTTYNCSWASSGWQSGAINVGNLERVEFDGRLRHQSYWTQWLQQLQTIHHPRQQGFCEPYRHMEWRICSEHRYRIMAVEPGGLPDIQQLHR